MPKVRIKPARPQRHRPKPKAKTAKAAKAKLIRSQDN
jgi:hypothetical protein